MTEPIAEKEQFHLCPKCGRQVSFSSWMTGYSVVSGYYSEILPFLCMDCYSQTEPQERHQYRVLLERERREDQSE